MCAPPIGASKLASVIDTMQAQATFASEAHLWYVEPDAIVDPGLLLAYRGLLNPAEIDRNDRFVFPRHRHQHLVTRALVRTVLSTYCPEVEPRRWEFATNASGRPEIAAPLVRPALRFNLSHTDGVIVCLVAGDREIGVDVEDTRRDGPTEEIAHRFFSRTEACDLGTLPVDRRRERFFVYWTLKEAYIKARGLGLKLPLDQFSFEVKESDHPIGISFGPLIDDDQRSWQFVSLPLTERHRAAVAIRRYGTDLSLRVRQTVPRRWPPIVLRTGASEAAGDVGVF